MLTGRGISEVRQNVEWWLAHRAEDFHQKKFFRSRRLLMLAPLRAVRPTTHLTEILP